jgi:hypothetical protein
MSDNIYTAIAEIQADPPVMVKDSDGQVGPRKYRYLSLNKLMETLLPELNRRGVVLIQTPTVVEGQPALLTELLHIESFTKVGETMLLMSSDATPQQQGSAITYARRYALTSILGLVADEDDDGAAVQSAAVPARKAAPNAANGSNPF